MSSADKPAVVKMKLTCPTQFLACLLCNCLVDFVFTACLYVFLACPVEMLLTWRLPILMGIVQVRSVYDMLVCFQLRSVSVDSLSEGGVLVLNQDTMASFFKQDGYSLGQDGKCNR